MNVCWNWKVSDLDIICKLLKLTAIIGYLDCFPEVLNLLVQLALGVVVCKNLPAPKEGVKLCHKSFVQTWRTALASRTAAKVLLIWFLISVALSTRSLWSSFAWVMAYSWKKEVVWKRSWTAAKHVWSHLLHIIDLLLSRCHLRLKCLALLCECVPVSCVVLQRNVILP